MTAPSTTRATTAQYLNAFRRELIDGGMPAEVANELVLAAGRMTLENDGIAVREVGGE